jgi:glycosyltransferase involved in cell wall biosynthesis
MAAITFVCGTPFGGAVDSTVSLAQQAVAHRHTARVLLPSAFAYDRLPRVTAGIVRLEERSGGLGAAAWRVHDWLSSRTSPTDIPLAERGSDVVAAARRVHPAGGLLVINSVRRLDLRRLLDLADATSSHSVWYLREETSLAMAAELGPRVGTLLANSEPLAREAGELAGRPCHFVPSVISREGLTDPGQRVKLLMVNPIASHGVDIALALARRSPHRQLVLQESWPLDDDDRAALVRAVSGLSNVELRPRTDRSQVFRDARALLLPHAAHELRSNRPRVALEAQLLGIPIVAHEIPGLMAVAGSVELLVREGAPLEDWADALDRLDADYQRFSDEARRFAERAMPDGEAVWSAFSEACPNLSRAEPSG